MVQQAIIWGALSLIALFIGDHIAWAVSLMSANLFVAASYVTEKLDDLGSNSNSDTTDNH